MVCLIRSSPFSWVGVTLKQNNTFDVSYDQRSDLETFPLTKAASIVDMRRSADGSWIPTLNYTSGTTGTYRKQISSLLFS